MLSKTNELVKTLFISLVFLLTACGLAAQKTVSGRIINNTDKKPVEGASVIVKGTNTGAATSSTGSFSITVPSDKSVLVISGTDFETLEVSVTGKNNLGDISLISTTLSLNEVVVTGYTAQRKKDITGAVSVVNVNNLKVVPSGTVESLLQGQAAGVTVINSGAPGSPSNVRIRGITTTGNVDPLVIIDGTPGNMHDLNVNDIESMQLYMVFVVLME
jgi:TonB-dependent starch-binding outer membrane protein SusC